MGQTTILDCLIAHEIVFVVIGGMAAVAHGSSQLTQDLDICVPLQAEAFLQLQTALQGLNPRVRIGRERVPLDLDRETAARLKNLYLLTDEGNLDCLGDVIGVGDYEAALRESLEIQLNGRPCRVLGLEALIRSKEALGRPRDLLAVTELRAILERMREPGGS